MNQLHDLFRRMHDRQFAPHCGEESRHDRRDRGRHQHFRGFGPGRHDRPDFANERGFGRERGFGHERGERHGRHGFGHGPGRLFDAGDIKLVVLKLLAEQPSYGYQLIKTMEERLAGGYAPSPGVIYPTLTMLEEEGLASVSNSDNKKVYSLTDQGTEFLAANKPRVDELFERLEEAGKGFRRGRSPEIMKAFGNLRGAIMARVSRGNATPEQIKKISDAVNAAAKTIDEL
jgi:DNA-binding PadR family transcriptional regulator